MNRDIFFFAGISVPFRPRKKHKNGESSENGIFWNFLNCRIGRLSGRIGRVGKILQGEPLAAE